MYELPDEGLAQSGSLDTQAQKMVIEGEEEWLILDLDELHEYIRRENKMKVYINDLINDLEWTIFLRKELSRKTKSQYCIIYMPLSFVDIAPGFNKQITPTAAQGQYVDGDNVRFRYGLPEKIGGWEQLTASTISRCCKSPTSMDRFRW